MSTHAVLFYDQILSKAIPCNIEPNFCEIQETQLGRRYYVRCKYDFTQFATYNVTKEEVYRYSSEIVQLNDVYPANTQAQIDYFNLVAPDKIINANDHESDEMDRFEAMIDMICDFTGDLDIDVFFNLAQFISYELLFTYCNQNERIFFQTISSVLLTQQPNPVEVPQMVRMVRAIFDKVDTAHPKFNTLKNGASPNKLYKLYNSRRYSELDYIPFPILIDIEVLEQNVNFITI